MHKKFIAINLKINVKKCFIVIFKGSKFKHDFNFFIGMHKIEMIQNFEYLGFLINDNLNEKDDIQCSRNKF